MTTKTRRTLLLLAPLALALGMSPAIVRAQQGKPSELSLGEAVSRAQHESRGQVLSAESRHYDRRTEYHIKVLTPEGHVRMMTIPANGGEGFRQPVQPNRNPPGRRAGGKEKH
ncbi:hypothetical protein [Rhodanobacter sp. DHG33]|uniref:PepSY domain-containing protein n=1 Tax=Rhodanobacter sp. DHG33 TaxID=2775921 RepID=UPI001786A34F|nr:hypothetical protein [Rhodanobacter sp. DHG33]MBD8898910.1 hypothetical protein [Rhodanobacter sp. DHG33]